MIIRLSDDGAQIDLSKPPYDTEGLTCCLLGNKGAGKSNALAVMAEEFHANQIPFIFYDPNGDAASLRQPGCVDGSDGSIPLRRPRGCLRRGQRTITWSGCRPRT